MSLTIKNTIRLAGALTLSLFLFSCQNNKPEIGTYFGTFEGIVDFGTTTSDQMRTIYADVIDVDKTSITLDNGKSVLEKSGENEVKGTIDAAENRNGYINDAISFGKQYEELLED